MPQLSSELQASFPFFNGVENRYLEGWDLFGFLIGALPGGIGNRSAIRLRNPVASNVLVVIFKLLIANDQGASISDNPTVTRNVISTDFATLAVPTNSRMDARGRPNPTLTISTGTNVGGITGTSFFRAGVAFGSVAGSEIDMLSTDIHEIPVLPGDAIDVYANNTNQGAGAISVWWRERFLEESERT